MAGGFKFKLNTGNIKKINEATKKAIEATGEKMLADKTRSQQIPFLEGTLQNVQTRIDKSQLEQGKLSIVHDTPYARRLYYHPEYNFTKLYNTQAQGEWWEDFLTGANKDKPKEYFKVYLKRYSGGTVQ